MDRSQRWTRFFLKSISYILVAMVSCWITLLLFCDAPSKLDRLQTLLSEQFIGEVDETALSDAAAEAMVQALGDRWSYYIPAEEYDSYAQTKTNTYVGIGIQILALEDETGFLIQKVEAGSGAQEAGLLAGDVVTHVEGQAVAQLGIEAAQALFPKEAGKKVTLTVLREGESLQFSPVCRLVENQVAKGTLLDGGIGLVRIENFNTNACAQTKEQIRSLLEQGATALIFDVRNNPGGYLTELTDLLDHLLPEGELIRSLYYTGEEKTIRSDAQCLSLPMAVLINENSFSAAEYFAAALQEAGWATVIGTQTVGKNYMQNTFVLPDGSGVNLSVGKYVTPKGVCLTEAGGVTPDHVVPLEEEAAILLQAGLLLRTEDPQLQTALEVLGQ